MLFPLRLALQFLTVVPITLPHPPAPADYTRSTAWYPCVGLLIGVPGALLALLADRHVPESLVALGVLILPVALTGALHLDGLADSCDGLFALRSREDRLMILKDSRIGTFGAIGLLMVLLSRYVALAALQPETLISVALLAPCIGRWSMLLSLRSFPAARPGSGLAGLFAHERGTWAEMAATATVVVASGALAGLGAAIAIVGSLVITLAIGRLAVARLGGVTGDIYGATSECVELGVQVAWAVVTTWR